MILQLPSLFPASNLFRNWFGLFRRNDVSRTAATLFQSENLIEKTLTAQPSAWCAHLVGCRRIIYWFCCEIGFKVAMKGSKIHYIRCSWNLQTPWICPIDTWTFPPPFTYTAPAELCLVCLSQCDGQYIPLPSLQGIAVLNIPSYAGGTNFWGGTKEDDVSTFTVDIHTKLFWIHPLWATQVAFREEEGCFPSSASVRSWPDSWFKGPSLYLSVSYAFSRIFSVVKYWKTAWILVWHDPDSREVQGEGWLERYLCLYV